MLRAPSHSLFVCLSGKLLVRVCGWLECVRRTSAKWQLGSKKSAKQLAVMQPKVNWSARKSCHNMQHSMMWISGGRGFAVTPTGHRHVRPLRLRIENLKRSKKQRVLAAARPLSCLISLSLLLAPIIILFCCSFCALYSHIKRNFWNIFASLHRRNVNAFHARPFTCLTFVLTLPGGRRGRQANSIRRNKIRGRGRELRRN